MNEVFLKKGDILPVIQTVISGNGTILDLTDVTGVNFAFRPRFSGTATVESGRVVTASAGLVEFVWTTGITSTVGPYYGEWRLLYSGNKQRTYPQDNYINFEIISGLI